MLKNEQTTAFALPASGSPTGRLQTSQPSMQRLNERVTPAPAALLDADFSSLELRIMAMDGYAPPSKGLYGNR